MNYTKDGKPFWNQLCLAPIRDEFGVACYLGIQTNVTGAVLTYRSQQFSPFQTNTAGNSFFLVWKNNLFFQRHTIKRYLLCKALLYLIFENCIFRCFSLYTRYNDSVQSIFVWPQQNSRSHKPGLFISRIYCPNNSLAMARMRTKQQNNILQIVTLS